MGLNKNSIKLLMQEGLRKPFHGMIVTLGKQDVSINYKELISLSIQLNYTLNDINNTVLEKDTKISDKLLFKMLGFSDVQSVDASSYENADILFDLNTTHLPDYLIGSAEVVLDAGTIEHVFHLPNSLHNIFQMLDIQGRVIHIAPSSNYIDHGFYMFSPTLFKDYYSANNFILEEIFILRHKINTKRRWKKSSYISGTLMKCIGSATNDLYAIYCIATKTEKSSSNIIPQQFMYKHNLWNKTKTEKSHDKIKKLIKTNRFLYSAASYFYNLYKKINFKKKFTNV